MKKLVSLLLALAMVMAIGIVSASAESDAPHIVIYMNNGAFSVATGSDKSMYTDMQNYILEKTGVVVDVIQPPSGSESEKLAVLLASGDQLDSWIGSWMDYAADGVIRKLNDYTDNEDYQKLEKIWADWDGCLEGMQDDKGNIWGVPRTTSTAAYPVFVRQDWLAQLGMDMPTTIDELEAYVYAVKEADFFGNGGTIPMSTTSVSDLEMTFLGGFVATGRGNWINEKGEVMPFYTAPGYKDFLETMHQWFEDGIFHKECFSWDATTLRQYIASGAVGSTAHWYSRVTLENKNLEANVPYDFSKTTYIYGICEDGLVGANGQKTQTLNGTRSTSGWLISSKCKNVEAFLKFTAWAYEPYNYNTLVYGFEGEHWAYDSNDPDAVANNKVVTLEGGRVYARDYVISLGLPTEVLTSEYYDDGRQDLHNYWLQHELGRGGTTCAMPGETWQCAFDKEAVSLNAPSAQDVETYYRENALRFINGERSLDEYDQFIEELYGVGLQEWIDEYTRQWDAFKG